MEYARPGWGRALDEQGVAPSENHGVQPLQQLHSGYQGIDLP